MKSFLRILLEVLGVAAYCALNLTVVPLLLIVGAGLRPLDSYAGLFYVVAGVGYLLTLAGLFRALIRRRSGRGLNAPALLDGWLVAFGAAVGLTAILIAIRLPLRFAGWDAHGFGATGGEANIVFLPWLHLTVWLAGKRWLRSDGPRS